MGDLAVVLRKPQGVQDTPFGLEMRQLEAKIVSAERSSFKPRWESGKKLLARRVGKQLPRGERDQLCKMLALSGSELNYRMAFAEQYDTLEKVSTAGGNFRSWQELRKSFTKKPRPQSIKRSEGFDLWLRGLDKELKKFKAITEFSEPQKRRLDSIYDSITRLYEEN